MVSFKIHSDERGTVLAACDKELLGQLFEEGNRQLEVLESFYGGEETTLELFEEKLKKYSNINLVGSRVVQKAIDLGLILEEHVLEIGGTPYALIFSL